MRTLQTLQTRIAPLLLLLLATCIPALSQGGSVIRQVIAPTLAQNGTGQPASFALVQACPSTAIGFPCSPLVSNVYQDPALTIPLPASFAADVNGNYQFFLPTGSYIVQETNAVGAGYSFQYSWLIFVNGTGTVSSVSLSLPASLFSVSGSPCTAICTLSGTFIAQSADTVFGNCTGSSATPVFCALVAGQIPSTLNATTINGLTVTGATTLSGGGTLTGTFGGNPTFSGIPVFGTINVTTGIEIGGVFGAAGTYLQSTGTGTVYATAVGTKFSAQQDTALNGNVTTPQVQSTLVMSTPFAAGALNALNKTVRITTTAHIAPNSAISSFGYIGIGNTSALGTYDITIDQASSSSAFNYSSIYTCTVNATGASGVLICAHNTTTDSATGPQAGSVGFNPIDLTQPVYFGPACSFSSASTSNLCTFYSFAVEQLN